MGGAYVSADKFVVKNWIWHSIKNLILGRMFWLFREFVKRKECYGSFYLWCVVHIHKARFPDKNVEKLW